MEIQKKILEELNHRIFTAMFDISGGQLKKTTEKKDTDFFIKDFRLETNFITGEIIWSNKRIEIYVLPYLNSKNLVISVYNGGDFICSEEISVNTQTEKLLSNEWSTHDYVCFLIDISTRKILEYEKIAK